MHLLDRRHLDFVLYEVLDVERLTDLDAFAEHDRTTFDAILATAETLARAHLAPSFAELDANAPRMVDGKAVLPEAIADAIAQLRDSGLFGIAHDPRHGGLGLPRTIANAAFLWLQAANVSIANYAFLTMSAAELLGQHASAEQKARYMRPMVEGRFLGTMALSEPHAGSSLGDITTTARPLDNEGRYAITGTKMWISGGEHDMAENIVHLMLARTPGAPAGVKGISLFIVPRRRLDADGNPAEWNHIALAGLNHKMGQRGTVNTVLNVGEDGETIGEIIGAPGQGLAQMFTMMNEARIVVSMGAVAHASAAYQHALAYARERLQGRHPDAKDPAAPQIPLIEHADVRRMLLQQKAASEGGVALGLTIARLADLKKAADKPDEQREAALLLDILTPVFKAWVSEEMLASNDAAIQVLGGAGYTRDHPLEQHWRDNRLNPIHEGTNGIQAMDLLGRKVVMQDGAALLLLLNRMRRTADLAATHAGLASLAAALHEAIGILASTTKALQGLAAKDGPRAYLANAHHYMQLTGLTVFAWIWLEQARVASAYLAQTDCSDRDFYDGKLAGCRYVFSHKLPECGRIAALLGSGERTYLDMRDAWF